MTEPDSAVFNDRTRDNRHNLKYSVFHLTIKKLFYYKCD